MVSGTTFAINGVNVKGGESYPVDSTLIWTLKTTDTTYGMRGVLICVAFTGGYSYTLASSQLNKTTFVLEELVYLV
jgi:hypothetical protein